MASVDNKRPSLADATAAASAKDKRLQLVGLRKSGYCGHIPKCIYYDRERLPASIHSGHNIPPRGKLQLDGTFVPTQSMVRAEQQRKEAAANAFKNVASVNEIGLQSGSSSARGGTSKGVRFNVTTGSETRVVMAAGAASNRGFVTGEGEMGSLAKPFTQHPTGHYSSVALAEHEGGFSTVGTGGDFSSTVSPPRSPTARYYRQMRVGEHDPDFGPHPGIANATSGVPSRYRHVGAGGVCSGRTDPYQYGKFLHHDDKQIHGAETKLLPHIYGAGEGPNGGSGSSNFNASNSMLRSNGGNGSMRNAAGIHAMVAGSGGVSASQSRAPSANGAGQLTPFPRYPVLRGPNRMGPRGLETFLTN